MRTGLTLGLLALATVLLRLPLLAPRLAHWDAVNYALALHDFNIAAHQPHPPGSPFFVLLGRVALALVGDDNSALRLVSVVASVAAVIGEYALARSAFGSRAGLLAAVVLMTQPVFWGYGTIANAWTVLACVSIGIGLMCWRLARGEATLAWAWASGLVMGVVSGFRLDAAVFLTPLWLWSLHRSRADRRQVLAALVLAGAVLLAWLIPVVLGAGGLGIWSDRLLALLPSSSTDGSRSSTLRQLAANTAIAFGTFLFVVAPAVVLSLVTSRRRTIEWLNRQVGAFWVLWVLPAFAFLWLVDATEPGHDLVFVGALLALGAGALSRAACQGWRLAVCGALLVGLQSGMFLLVAPQANRPLAWTMNSMLLNVTAPGLRRQQIALDAALRTIRTNFDPRSSVVVTLIGQDPYRFLMYYLPEYSLLRVDPAMQRVLTARGGKEGNWTEVGDCLFAGLVSSTQVERAAWVVSTPSEPGTVPDSATLLSSADEPDPFQVWRVDTDTSTAADYLGFRLTSNCG